jgi:hypothetical protein
MLSVGFVKDGTGAAVFAVHGLAIYLHLFPRMAFILDSHLPPVQAEHVHGAVPHRSNLLRLTDAEAFA